MITKKWKNWNNNAKTVTVSSSFCFFHQCAPALLKINVKDWSWSWFRLFSTQLKCFILFSTCFIIFSVWRHKELGDMRSELGLCFQWHDYTCNLPAQGRSEGLLLFHVDSRSTCTLEITVMCTVRKEKSSVLFHFSLSSPNCLPQIIWDSYCFTPKHIFNRFLFPVWITEIIRSVSIHYRR